MRALLQTRCGFTSSDAHRSSMPAARHNELCWPVSVHFFVEAFDTHPFPTPLWTEMAQAKQSAKGPAPTQEPPVLPAMPRDAKGKLEHPGTSKLGTTRPPTLRTDSTHCWRTLDASVFKVRGPTYFEDVSQQRKSMAAGTASSTCPPSFGSHTEGEGRPPSRATI